MMFTADTGSDMFRKPFHRSSLSGMGDIIDTTGSSDSATGWITGLTNAIPSIVTAYDTQQILSANAARLAQGLPPLDPSAYAPSVNIGLSPAIQTGLIVGGIALLLVLMMRKSR